MAQSQSELDLMEMGRREIKLRSLDSKLEGIRKKMRYHLDRSYKDNGIHSFIHEAALSLYEVKYFKIKSKQAGLIGQGIAEALFYP
ncbi:hypothetical protein HYX15_00500 [Candidatus Woesearchaeota archaeon]|nr:hypothetical protein [Candidatus Woesearchaeota archaeon]